MIIIFVHEKGQIFPLDNIETSVRPFFDIPLVKKKEERGGGCAILNVPRKKDERNNFQDTKM